MASTFDIAMQYLNKGVDLVFQDELQQGIDNLNLAKSIFEELDDAPYIIRANWGLALGYREMGYDSKMLSKCLNMIQYADKECIKGAKCYFYNCICERYISLENYDGALNYALLAKQDLEDFNNPFFATPLAHVVIYFNLALIYTKIGRMEDAEYYLKLATNISRKNDMTQHDFCFAVVEAQLKLAAGNKDFIDEHIDTLTTYSKTGRLAFQTYFNSLRTLAQLLCSIKEFKKAEDIINTQCSSAYRQNDYKLILEATKLLMYIAKSEDNDEKYNKACVNFAEASISYYEYKANKNLTDMDTLIALSIADTPIDLI